MDTILAIDSLILNREPGKPKFVAAAPADLKTTEQSHETATDVSARSFLEDAICCKKEVQGTAAGKGHLRILRRMMYPADLDMQVVLCGLDSEVDEDEYESEFQDEIEQRASLGQPVDQEATARPEDLMILQRRPHPGNLNMHLSPFACHGEYDEHDSEFEYEDEFEDEEQECLDAALMQDETRILQRRMHPGNLDTELAPFAFDGLLDEDEEEYESEFEEEQENINDRQAD